MPEEMPTSQSLNKSKKSLIVGIVIFIILAAGVAWLISRQEPGEGEPGTEGVAEQEALLVFENKREDLTEEQVEKYFGDFTAAANGVRSEPTGFNLAAMMEVGWV